MNQEQHNLDDFLRKKVEEAEFTYSDNYWKTMSGILDEQDSRKPRMWLWRGLSALLLVTLIGGAAYYIRIKQSASEQKAVSVLTKQHAITQQNNQDDLMPDTTNDYTEKTDQQPTTGNPVKSSFKTPQDASSTGNTNTAPFNQTVITEPTNEIGSEESEQAGTSKNQPELSDVRKQESKSSNSKLKKRQKSSITKIEADKESSLAKNNTADDQISPKAKSSSPKNKKVGKKPTSNADLNKSPETIPEVSKTTLVNGKPMQATDTQRFQRSVQDPRITNPRYIASLSNYIPERYDSVTIISFQPAAVTDQPKKTTVDSNLSNSDPQSTSPKLPAHAWFIAAGVNVNKAFNGNATPSGQFAATPYAGLGIQKMISKRITLAAQIGFTMVNGLNSRLTIPSYTYGFGLDSSQIVLDHRTILQSYLPLTLQYMAHRRHQFFASMGIAYNWDIGSRIQDYSVSQNQGFSTAGSPSAKSVSRVEYGYNGGFEKLDVFTQFGYAFQLSPSLKIETAVAQGLRDLTKNTYFKNNVADRQTRMSVGLKYVFNR
jgi:hypothetical protein